jgi:polyphosphate kinase
VDGLSETIRVRSIFGRNLEHSRIYSFEAGGRQSLLIGSADLMPRNLDHRIEVLVPIDSARVLNELNAVLDSVFSDNTFAWELGPDDTWSRTTPGERAKLRSHQTAMHRRALVRARRRRDGRARER